MSNFDELWCISVIYYGCSTAPIIQWFEPWCTLPSQDFFRKFNKGEAEREKLPSSALLDYRPRNHTPGNKEVRSFYFEYGTNIDILWRGVAFLWSVRGRGFEYCSAHFISIDFQNLACSEGIIDLYFIIYIDHNLSFLK